jgi:hypothetical protein
MISTGTIIALAWPDTKVIHEGKWYDKPMRWVGAINKEGYYNAGHAAFLLIHSTTGAIEYFDFGRYQTPMKYGRVRSKLSDPDIEMKHKALISNGKILNLEEILIERFHNKACHGEGRLTASIVKNIDYNKAYQKAILMQKREAIDYGPFEFGGSTCSRFVAQTVLQSSADWLTRLLIIFPYTVSSTPRSNNKVLNDSCYYYEIRDGKAFLHKSKFYSFKKLMGFKKKTAINVNVNHLEIDYI